MCAKLFRRLRHRKWTSKKNDESDRWWIVAACVTGAICGLAALLWSFPTSKWAWILVAIVLLFAAVFYFNPRYKYWRRASWCFGIAGVLGMLPTFTLKANVEGVAAIEFLSESSPITVLGFLGAGLVLAWFDSRQHRPHKAKSAVESNNVNLSPVNSSNSIASLEAGRDIVVHQGVSEEVLLAALDVQRIAPLLPSEGITESTAVDEEIVWQLVDDIKSARRRLEREEATRLITQLSRSFDRVGGRWSSVLRTESLLLMAEEERAKIAQSRANGEEVDLNRFQALLKELGNV